MWGRVNIVSRDYRSLFANKKINCLEKKIAEANANKHKSYLVKLDN